MNLSINSKFRPFTYDEMIKPIVQYKEAYEALEKDYSNLSAQTEMMRDYAEREANPKAYDRFNRYSNDLEAVMDDFSRGMNPNNRRALLGLKRRYYDEIEPIAKASKKIEELSAEQRKLAASNPNIMFDRDFSSEVSIDQMMDNPNLSYRAIDGNDLYTKGAAIAKSMSSRLHNVSPALRGQYWEIRQGFGEEAANKFLLDSGAIPELNKALEDLVGATDAPDKIKGRAFEYARQGAISGMVGNTSYQTNRGYESPADTEKREQSKYLFQLQTGQIPFRTDEKGNKYYFNAAANQSWIETPSGETKSTGNVKGSTSGNPSSIVEDSDNPGYGRDSKGNAYKKTSVGYQRIPESQYPKPTTSEKRIVERNDRVGQTESKPVPVVIATLNSEGDSMTPTPSDKVGDFSEKWAKADKQGKTQNISYGDLPDKLKKEVDGYLKGEGLHAEDVDIFMQNSGWLTDSRIMIKVKQTKSASSSTEPAVQSQPDVNTVPNV